MANDQMTPEQKLRLRAALSAATAATLEKERSVRAAIAIDPTAAPSPQAEK
jgi:hypothetical protein